MILTPLATSADVPIPIPAPIRRTVSLISSRMVTSEFWQLTDEQREAYLTEQIALTVQHMQADTTISRYMNKEHRPRLPGDELWAGQDAELEANRK